MASVRIAVISDERFFHDSFNRILTGVSSFVVVPLDKRRDAERAIVDACVDVAVIDYRMKDSLDLCRAIVRATGPAVLMLQVPADDCVAAAALTAGSRGIVYTSSPVDDAISAIAAVAKGQLWAASLVVERWMSVQFASQRARSDTAASDRRLSGRELEVLQHAAIGLANKEGRGPPFDQRIDRQSSPHAHPFASSDFAAVPSLPPPITACCRPPPRTNSRVTIRSPQCDPAAR